MQIITRKASANWKGDLEAGHGLVSTESHSMTETKYSFKERIEGQGRNTNPEELIAASAASCFSMALSKTLQDQGVISENIQTTAEVDLGVSDSGPKLSELRLRVEAIIPEFDDTKLEEAVSTTADNCPVYQLLKPGFDGVKLSSRIQR